MLRSLFFLSFFFFSCHPRAAPEFSRGFSWRIGPGRRRMDPAAETNKLPGEREARKITNKKQSCPLVRSSSLVGIPDARTPAVPLHQLEPARRKRQEARDAGSNSVRARRVAHLGPPRYDASSRVPRLCFPGERHPGKLGLRSDNATTYKTTAS